MQVRSLIPFFAALPFVTIALISSSIPVQAATPFAVAATNVTMPSSGNGTSNYTVTGTPLAGNLAVTCQYSGPTTDAHLPTCTYGPIALIPVEQGQTVKGSVSFYPYGVGVPARLPVRQRVPATGLALAGALLLGLRLRRTRRLLAASIVAVAMFAALLTIPACSGGPNGMTPGTYQFTISVENAGAVNNLAMQTATNISVTIP